MTVCVSVVEAMTPRREDEAPPMLPMDVVLLYEADEIIAGVAMEYYCASRIGLISYFVVRPSHRRKGLLRVLVERGVVRLDSMAIDRHGEPCRLVIAETNKLGVYDGVVRSAVRHRVFRSVGFAMVDCPYLQPPLATSGRGACHDVVLCVYTGAPPREHLASVPSAWIASFLDEFCETVWGTDTSAKGNYQHLDWYINVMRWLNVSFLPKTRQVIMLTKPCIAVEHAKRRGDSRQGRSLGNDRV